MEPSGTTKDMSEKKGDVMTEVVCAVCGTLLDEVPNIEEESRSPCPSCGSRDRKVGIHRERIVDPTTDKVVGPDETVGPQESKGSRG